MGGFLALCSTLLLLLLTPRAGAQHIYLDADGDGVPTHSDRLNPSGETVLVVYLDTSHDSDGTFRPCNDHSNAEAGGASLDIFSYNLILKLEPKSGSVRWGEFTDGVGFTADRKDRSSSTELLVARRGNDALSPGRYVLGRIRITTTGGSPILTIGSDSRLDPAAFTGFGTHCNGSNYPNTYVLGTDWFDTGTTTTSVDPGPMSLGLSVGSPSTGPSSTSRVFVLSLPAPARVRLAIYDVGGRLVRTIVEAPSMAAGKRTLVWDGRTTNGQAAASGIYFVRLDAGSAKLTRRFALVK